METISMGESESDVGRINDRMRNHNPTGFILSEEEYANEEYVIERLKRTQRKECTDYEDNYEFVNLLNWLLFGLYIDQMQNSVVIIDKFIVVRI